jgi:hypothetical protein
MDLYSASDDTKTFFLLALLCYFDLYKLASALVSSMKVEVVCKDTHIMNS